MLNFDLNRIILILPGILLALTVHEFSHGYVAFLIGDPTAKNNGRLTLNPIAHIDPLGFLMLMFAGFGWAKPVPVNPYYFTIDRRKGTLLVSLAGPASNIVLAILLTLVFGLVIRFTGGLGYVTQQLFISAISINLVLAVFNLFPIPPLDGSKILISLFPSRFEQTFHEMERYTYLILILLLVLGVIRRVLFPIVNVLFSLLMGLLTLIV
ncbi:MAG: site-2 protease family protein [Bacillota bacterium]|nr:site-2 protease family protein [Bacillota bacterium]MDW7678348.1 site-2 protease family protein [Bacillota bacterium]